MSQSNEKINGKILSGIGGLYTVLTERGSTVPCTAKGAFRHNKISPYPGDNVQIQINTTGNNTLCEIYSRHNFFTRPPAANIDKLFITIACADPSPSYITSDKLICAAEFYSVEPIIIITKSDLDYEKSCEIYEVYKKSGFEVFMTSSKTDTGLDELKSFIENKIKGVTAVFTGESGVGKSSVLNSLFPNLKLATGEISQRISRGKHTTRAVTLYPLDSPPSYNGSFLADTPGFGIFDLASIQEFTKDFLLDCFREFSKFATDCKYKKCSHTQEDGCAVIKAVKEGIIPKQRHESFVCITDEVKDKHPWQSKK